MGVEEGGWWVVGTGARVLVGAGEDGEGRVGQVGGEEGGGEEEEAGGERLEGQVLAGKQEDGGQGEEGGEEAG